MSYDAYIRNLEQENEDLKDKVLRLQYENEQLRYQIEKLADFLDSLEVPSSPRSVALAKSVKDGGETNNQ